MASSKSKEKSTPPAQVLGGVAIPDHIKIPKNLPRPSAGKNLTKPQKLKIAKIVCELYATDLFSLDSILRHFKIKSYNTWKNWVGQFAEIATLYKESTSEKEARYFYSLKGRARTSLEKKVDGHFVVVKTTKIRRPRATEVAEFQEMGHQSDIKLVVEEIQKQIYIPPSDSAIQYVLNNQDGDNFAKNPLPVAPDEKDVDIPPINWVE